MLLKQFFVEKIAHSSYLHRPENRLAPSSTPGATSGSTSRPPAASGPQDHPHPRDPPPRRLHLRAHGPGQGHRGQASTPPQSAKLPVPPRRPVRGRQLPPRGHDAPGPGDARAHARAHRLRRHRHGPGPGAGRRLLRRHAFRRRRRAPGPLPQDRPASWPPSLYDSLHQKLMKLPDFCEVYPAHGAGSLCGRAIGAKRTSPRSATSAASTPPSRSPTGRSSSAVADDGHAAGARTTSAAAAPSTPRAGPSIRHAADRAARSRGLREGGEPGPRPSSSTPAATRPSAASTSPAR
ncbi:MAG: hypothetical protein MZV70_70455 [Desulfobacterales bacterium]|nr:hypothetical protein [Desulfobacterales bacterium]